jgi:hypothetical protein
MRTVRVLSLALVLCACACKTRARVWSAPPPGAVPAPPPAAVATPAPAPVQPGPAAPARLSKGFTPADSAALDRLEAACVARRGAGHRSAELQKAASLAVGAQGAVTDEHGDGMYGDPDRTNYLGRVSKGATVRYAGGYGYTKHCTTHMKVLVVADSHAKIVGQTGWIGIDEATF